MFDAINKRQVRINILKKFTTLKLIFLLLSLSTFLYGQEKDLVEVAPNLTKETVLKKCKTLDLGKSISSPRPIYPDVARAGRIGGTITVEILIDEKGNVLDIINIDGIKILQDAAKEAAFKAKFTPTVCDGQMARVNALMIYNFIPFVITENYFQPEKIEDFIDISKSSPYYESILFLTENYKLTFGYGDKKFHSDAPLTKGDFAHFLRLTLDFLRERATLANKTPGEIELYYAHNPYNIKSTGDIKDYGEKQPYALSLGFLLSKYDIGLIDENRNFNGKFPITNNEVIDYWTKVFGEISVPLHFNKIKTGDKIFTRGEFSLFLQESLYILTYKVLP